MTWYTAFLLSSSIVACIEYNLAMNCITGERVFEAPLVPRTTVVDLTILHELTVLSLACPNALNFADFNVKFKKDIH